MELRILHRLRELSKLLAADVHLAPLEERMVDLFLFLLCLGVHTDSVEVL